MVHYFTGLDATLIAGFLLGEYLLFYQPHRDDQSLGSGAHFF